VATQHRSRRARASRIRQTYDADALAARSDSDDESTPLALVVDDEPLIRQLVSTVLRRRGWTVIEAADGSVALSVVGELPVLMVSGRPDVARNMRIASLVD
jgi:PleD family two-component response regulator